MKNLSLIFSILLLTLSLVFSGVGNACPRDGKSTVCDCEKAKDPKADCKCKDNCKGEDCQCDCHKEGKNDCDCSKDKADGKCDCEKEEGECPHAKEHDCPYAKDKANPDKSEDSKCPHHK